MKKVEILLVEDNPGDAELTREALAEGKIRNNLIWKNNGESALEYLKKQLLENNLPDVILLDLNLPRISGKEVLKELKKTPSFKHIPVIILTTSTDEADILQSYELNANSYLIKPVKLYEFMEMMNSFEEFWLTYVKLPKEQGD